MFRKADFFTIEFVSWYVSVPCVHVLFVLSQKLATSNVHTTFYVAFHFVEACLRADVLRKTLRLCIQVLCGFFL